MIRDPNKMGDRRAKQQRSFPSRSRCYWDHSQESIASFPIDQMPRHGRCEPHTRSMLCGDCFAGHIREWIVLAYRNACVDEFIQDSAMTSFVPVVLTEDVAVRE